MDGSITGSVFRAPEALRRLVAVARADRVTPGTDDPFDLGLPIRRSDWPRPGSTRPRRSWCAPAALLGPRGAPVG